MPSATARAEASSTSLTTTDEPTAPKRSAIAWPMPFAGARDDYDLPGQIRMTRHVSPSGTDPVPCVNGP
jgi:hypothetical protein